MVPSSLNLDGEGWTIFSPSEDSRLIYISSSGDDATASPHAPADAEVGQDPFNPVGPVNAFATFSEAYSYVREGYPDWVLFKRGDMWIVDSLGVINKSGRSQTEPILYSFYGDSGSLPLIVTTDHSREAIFIGAKNFISISGLHLYAQGRNPNDGGSVIPGNFGVRVYSGSGDVQGVLIEGCTIEFYGTNIDVSITEGNSGSVTIRRNTIKDAYNIGSHSQGLYARMPEGSLLVEENVFIHNGWLVPSTSGGGDSDGGQATVFNHSTYLSSVYDLEIKNNVSVIPSASNIKLTRERQLFRCLIDGELQAGGADCCQAGNNYTDPEYDYHFKDLTIINCTYTRGGKDNILDIAAADGITFGGVDGGLISSNLIMNYDPSAQVSKAYAAGYSKSRNVTVEGNVAYNAARRAIGRWGAPVQGSEAIIVKNNIFQNELIEMVDGVMFSDYDSRPEFTFSGNKYFAQNELFNANGNAVDLQGWNEWSGDSGTWEQVSFTDSSRDIEAYMQSVGEEATFDAFVSACRAQSRVSWDTRFTARAVGDWIREGFDLSQADAPATPTPSGMFSFA